MYGIRSRTRGGIVLYGIKSRTRGGQNYFFIIQYDLSAQYETLLHSMTTLTGIIQRTPYNMIKQLAGSSHRMTLKKEDLNR